jgi:hypothetical protein
MIIGVPDTVASTGPVVTDMVSSCVDFEDSSRTVGEGLVGVFVTVVWTVGAAGVGLIYCGHAMPKPPQKDRQQTHETAGLFRSWTDDWVWKLLAEGGYAGALCCVPRRKEWKRDKIKTNLSTTAVIIMPWVLHVSK